MAQRSVSGPFSLRLPLPMVDKLEAQLFPGDGDEHGAVIGASVVETSRGCRLLGRRLFLAEDGVDYVPGNHGYRMLTADFVRRSVLACAEEGLAYLAVHNHLGTDRVAFSCTDMASHRRGYPALVDILNGPPVGGLVFARKAVAGDLWLSAVHQEELDNTVVVGRSRNCGTRHHEGLTTLIRNTIARCVCSEIGARRFSLLKRLPSSEPGGQGH